MTAGTAISLRRAGFVTMALASTGTAHALTSDAIHLTPLAPLIWANVFAAVFLLSRVASRRRFAPWGPARTLIALGLSQLGAHLALDALPWTLGLQEHHPVGLTVASVAIHLCAAGLLTAVLRCGDRLLARLVRVVGQLLSAGRRRPRLPRAVRALVATTIVRCAARIVASTSSRGPPRAVTAA